jgi:hypothetical protein
MYGIMEVLFFVLLFKIQNKFINLLPLSISFQICKKKNNYKQKCGALIFQMCNQLIGR